ncbi:hypothetical protein QBC44DRAFT_161000 [Cladorrhinum sp. PSN332]|nr:hypothetical protein QBC44DRAFT_161000 [Cladorrhinum sp. PSN332]
MHSREWKGRSIFGGEKNFWDRLTAAACHIWSGAVFCLLSRALTTFWPEAVHLFVYCPVLHLLFLFIPTMIRKISFSFLRQWSSILDLVAILDTRVLFFFFFFACGFVAKQSKRSFTNRMNITAYMHTQKWRERERERDGCMGLFGFFSRLFFSRGLDGYVVTLFVPSVYTL